MIDFEAKQATSEQWQRLHDYRKARAVERDELDRLTPNPETEAMLKMDDPFGHAIRKYVQVDGRFVAGSQTYIQNPTAPGYESNKHLLDMNIAVLGPHRRKGIGTMFLKDALDIMKANQKSVVTAWTDEDDGRTFLGWVGAEAKYEESENRLHFNEVDWEMVHRWVEDGKSKNQKSEIIFFEGRIPKDKRAEIAPVFSDLLNTMPFEELDHGDIVVNEDLIGEQYKRLDALKGEHYIYIVKDPDGSIVGMTDVQWLPFLPDRILQNFTGVHPDARGRGLGKMLKAMMLEYVKKSYPEVKMVVTENANSNDSMLAINHRLGFKAHKSGSAYQMSREDLEKFCANLS